MNFIDDCYRKVFCRLGVSPIHGIGVFAIRDIPQGINPMQETRNVEFETRPVAAMDGLPAGIQKLIKDMCPEEDGVYYVPPFSLNEMGISYYLNHSETPNMLEEDGDFVTARAIKEGEELTVNYGTYGKLNL